MTVLRKIFGTSIAIAVALTVSEPSAFAQAGGAAPATPAQGGQGAGAGGAGQAGGRGGRGGAPLYTPAAGAKDLKAVLFNWAWYTGMLRSSEEYDLIMSLEYQGKGAIRCTFDPPSEAPQPAPFTSRCDDGRENLRRLGRQQAGVDVSDSRRSQRDGNRDAQRQVHGGARGGEAGSEDLRVHLQQL